MVFLSFFFSLQHLNSTKVLVKNMLFKPRHMFSFESAEKQKFRRSQTQVALLVSMGEVFWRKHLLSLAVNVLHQPLLPSASGPGFLCAFSHKSCSGGTTRRQYSAQICFKCIKHLERWPVTQTADASFFLHFQPKGKINPRTLQYDPSSKKQKIELLEGLSDSFQPGFHFQPCYHTLLHSHLKKSNVLDFFSLHWLYFDFEKYTNM